MSKATVIGMVAKLKTLGHLAVEHGTAGQPGRGHSNRYRMILKGAQVLLFDQERVTPAYSLEIVKGQPIDPLESGKGQPVDPLFVQKGQPAKQKGQPADQNHSKNKKEKKDKTLTICSNVVRATVTDTDFDDFWKAYPLKVGKIAARKAYAKAIKDGASTADLLAGAQREEIKQAGKNPKYIKHPTTWLNAGCWMDEPEKPWTDPHSIAGAFNNPENITAILANIRGERLNGKRNFSQEISDAADIARSNEQGDTQAHPFTRGAWRLPKGCPQFQAYEKLGRACAYDSTGARIEKTEWPAGCDPSIRVVNETRQVSSTLWVTMPGSQQFEAWEKFDPSPQHFHIHAGRSRPTEWPPGHDPAIRVINGYSGPTLELTAERV